MPATFQFSESNGILETVTDGISNVNFGINDTPNLVPSINPIIRGNPSYSKYIRAKFTGIWTDISNILFWKSLGNYLTGESIKASANGIYATPSRTSTGDGNIPLTEGTALNINSAEGENHIEYGITGVSGYSAYIRLQQQTTILTPTGNALQKTFILQYDEV